MRLSSMIVRHKEPLLYLVFGGFTTLINVASFVFCYELCGLNNVLSTILAWQASILFAFISNKLFVFESKKFSTHILLKEWSAFLLCRLLTGLLDIGIMYVAVNIFALSPILWKLLANIVVIISNWLISKYYIFHAK